MNASFSDEGVIASNLGVVRGRMESACMRVGRDSLTVDLVAVTKTHPAGVVRAAYGAGQRIFGENRVQELVAKAPELPGAARWHHIGHLQKNKIRKLLPWCELIHGVDSVDLAREIERIAAEAGVFSRVLLQVNLAEETTKFGFPEREVVWVLRELADLTRLTVEGLMAIPPPVKNPEESRPRFRALRELRDRCEQDTGLPLPVLSMGMSGDYEVAIEEGATLVRVGSAIFGARPPMA
jgi:PLP dependent protein